VAILGYNCAGYTVDKSTPTTTSQIDWHIPHLQAYFYFAVVVVGESVMQNLCMLTADKTRTKESYWVLKTRQLYLYTGFTHITLQATTGSRDTWSVLHITGTSGVFHV